MRLTCPNCGAQYEVDDRAIPEEGRDVQCSSCSHTWFQVSAAAQAAAEAAAESVAPTMAAPEPTEAAPAQSGATETAPDDAAPPESEGPQPVRPQRRRALDDNIQAVLREEAEREKRAREAEGPVQIQPELGVPAPPPKPAPPPPAVAPPAVAPEAADDDVADEEPQQAPRGSRRNLLPDIEQINSTLRANAQADFPSSPPESEPTAVEQEKSRRSFRRGFSYAVLIVAVILGLYNMGPQLARRYPALAGPLTGLHSTIDSYRGWLDQKVMAVVAMLDKHR